MTSDTDYPLGETNAPTDDGRPRLKHRTLSRSDAPNRCTVFPAEASGVPRMSTWLTVDAGCLVDLERMR